MTNLEIEKSLDEIKKDKRKFEQSVDLIINLRKFDVKKNVINGFVTLPNRIKDKRICGFIDTKTNLIDTIPKSNFSIYNDKKKIKDLVKKYDFFISSAINMPSVATTFGRVLGPVGKMPSPKLGILTGESEKDIQELINKINSIVRVQAKEPSIKLTIGKENMNNNNLTENIQAVYNFVLNELPNKKEQIKSVMIKLTMGKPIKISI